MSSITDVVWSGEVRDEERPGWCLDCPHCKKQVRYTELTIDSGMEPFLYSSDTADFVLRDEDIHCLVSLVSGTEPTISELRKFYHELESTLAPCPTGGRFQVWANVKCPHCNYEFPYNRGVTSEAIRYFETKIVWVEGATAFRGPSEPSNRLARVKLSA